MNKESCSYTLYATTITGSGGIFVYWLAYLTCNLQIVSSNPSLTTVLFP